MNDARALCEAAISVDAPTKGLTAWVHLLPLGDVKARDGRAWKLTDPQAVIAASQKYANGAPIPIDYDHQLVHTKENGRPAVAAGWINKFEARHDGIWASVEWTRQAADLLKDRQYRFISPYFGFNSQTGEITAIYHAGLTNTPALTLTALASAKAPMKIDAQFVGELRSALGLGETAAPDVIVEAVRSLTAKAATTSAAPDRFVPIEVFEEVTARLNQMSRGVSDEAAEMCVNREIQAGKLLPSLKTWAVALCRENKPAFEGFVQRTSGGLQHLFVDTVSGRPGSELSATSAEAEVAKNLGLEVADLTKTPRTSK